MTPDKGTCLRSRHFGKYPHILTWEDRGHSSRAIRDNKSRWRNGFLSALCERTEELQFESKQRFEALALLDSVSHQKLTIDTTVPDQKKMNVELECRG